MSWAIGWDENWNRDVGYGVPAWCDCGCGKEIDRGLSYVCGGEPFGGERGCGLYFDPEHLVGRHQLCPRCRARRKPFTPTPDHLKWLHHKMTHESWADWRKENGLDEDEP